MIPVKSSWGILGGCGFGCFVIAFPTSVRESRKETLRDARAIQQGADFARILGKIELKSAFPL